MNQIRKPLLGLMAALIALFAVVALTGGSENSGAGPIAERPAPGPSA